MPRLEREQLFPRPRAEVFDFFSDAANLTAITPPFLNFRIVSPLPIDMRPGELIDYKLRLFGVPFSWTTRIETYEAPDRFTDIQLKGPYKKWHHLHTFEDIEGGTRMRDVVDYELPLGPLGSLAHAVAVKRSLKRIFDYRHEVMAKRFGTLDSDSCQA